MIKQVCQKIPTQVESFTKIKVGQFLTKCPNCNGLFIELNIKYPVWWQICLQCKQVYVIVPQICQQLDGWDTKNCCQKCHGNNILHKDALHTYYHIDGSLIDICCLATTWLKSKDLLKNIEGAGDTPFRDFIHSIDHLTPYRP